MRRPLGMTLLALALSWLALGGLVFGIVSPTLAWAGLPWMLYEVAGLVYAGSAIVAAVGVWKLTPWADRAFQVWLVVSFAVGTIPMFTLPSGEPWRWILPLGWAFVLALLIPVGTYVRSSVRPAA